MCGSGVIGTEHLRPCDCITLLQVIQYLVVSEKVGMLMHIDELLRPCRSLVVSEKVGMLMHIDELLRPCRRRPMYARIADDDFTNQDR